MASILPSQTGLKDDDIRDGHKVVAMPNCALGGKSVRDAVPSQNADYRSTTTPSRRSRSGSTGRSSALGSRYIVQDVYDRMGVNYIRGRPSIENMLEDDKALGIQNANNEAVTPTPRGRAAIRRNEAYDDKSSAPSRGRRGNSNDSDRRRRLPSRGRISTIWPPTDAAGSTGNHKHSSGASQPSAVDPVLLLTSGTSFLKEHKSYAPRRSMPQPSRPDLRQSYTESRDEMKQDEPSPQDDDRDCVSVKSVKSMKDRINAFGASSRPSTAARGNVRRSFNSKFTKPPHPKKVDIYANSTVSADNQGVEKDVAEAFLDASDNVGLNSYVNGGEPRFSAANSTLHRSTNSRNAPVIEIPSDQLHVGDEDLASIAASSVSGEDFAESPKKRNRTDDKFSSSFAGKDGPPDAHIEKLVEERVQAHIATLTEKFEGEIRQIEHRMEQDYKARIDELENKTDKVNSILSKILVNKEVSEILVNKEVSGRFEI